MQALKGLRLHASESTAMASTGAIPRLSVEGLTKRYGGLVANDDVSLQVMPGELHCLLGENGAGKSTLSSCIFGMTEPDQGRILIDGRVVNPRKPADALAAGIGMVHQHFVLAPPLSVLDNIVVGTGRGLMRNDRLARRTVLRLGEHYDLPIKPDAIVEDLSVGEQQWVEILKALYFGARLLILDEPTASLTPKESERLFAIVRRLTADGIAVILISHKMGEVMQSDRVSVLRKGRIVATVETAGTTAHELASLMVGRAVSSVARAHHGAVSGEALLTLSGVGARAGDAHRTIKGVDLELKAGEIVGIAGVAGNGQDELFEAIMGLIPCDAGDIRLAGRSLAGLGVAERARLGIGYVPNDRYRDGLVGDMTIAENVILGAQWSRPWRHGLAIDRSAVTERGQDAIDTLAIAAPGPQTLARRLSGGNAQKIILAREMRKATKALLCNQPTRGLDIGVVAEVHQRLLAMRAAGIAILMASEDLEDVLALSDRIAVMFRGEILAVLPREHADLDRIGRLMAGERLEVPQ